LSATSDFLLSQISFRNHDVLSRATLPHNVKKRLKWKEIDEKNSGHKCDEDRIPFLFFLPGLWMPFKTLYSEVTFLLFVVVDDVCLWKQGRWTRKDNLSLVRLQKIQI
jgi:hypothetical protein